MSLFFYIMKYIHTLEEYKTYRYILKNNNEANIKVAKTLIKK